MAGRKRYSREFKAEAVRLVRERGVSMAQAARDLDVHVNVLRSRVREHRVDPAEAFLGRGDRALHLIATNVLDRHFTALLAPN